MGIMLCSDMDVDRLYHRHAQRLYGFLAYRTGDRLLAEDLLGDVFERTLRAKRRFDPRRGSEEAWLYSIAVNVLRDHARRVGAEQRALARVDAPAASVAAGDDAIVRRGELLGALQHLSDEERETVALRFGADLTIAQIAKATGERETTIDGRLRRGLRRLREQLDDASAGEAPTVSPR